MCFQPAEPQYTSACGRVICTCVSWGVPCFCARDTAWQWKWASHSGSRFLRLSGSCSIQCLFLKKKLQQERIVTRHTCFLYGGNSNRMQKPFHLLLKNFTVCWDAAHLSHDSSFVCQTDSSLVVLRSQPGIFSFLNGGSMKHFGESQNKGAREVRRKEVERESEVPKNMVTLGQPHQGKVRAQGCQDRRHVLSGST